MKTNVFAQQDHRPPHLLSRHTGIRDRDHRQVASNTMAMAEAFAIESNFFGWKWKTARREQQNQLRC